MGLGESQRVFEESRRQPGEVDPRFADLAGGSVRAPQGDRPHVRGWVGHAEEIVEAVERRRPVGRDMAQVPLADQRASVLRT